MARLGDHLVIGDSHRIHVVSLQDAGAHTFGREGQGPTEFDGSIESIGGFGTDTIAAFDVFKVLLFSLDGDFLTSYRTTPQLPFSRTVTGIMAFDRPVYPLVRSGSGVLWERTTWEGTRTSVEEGGTSYTVPVTILKRGALLWHDLEEDTAAVLKTWDYVREDGPEPGMAAFPELVEHAIASDGRVATGYPDRYCIQLFHAFEEGVRMGCRERSQIPVEAGFSDVTLLPGAQRGVTQNLEANPVDVLPHFGRLLFSESGDLWVNLYHEEFAHVHRLLFTAGVVQPRVREWEVFDGEAGLVRHVTLPGAFDLRVIGDGEAFGFLTLGTGEVVVGRVDLTESAVLPT